jgi:hypothetical protein
VPDFQAMLDRLRQTAGGDTFDPADLGPDLSVPIPQQESEADRISRVLNAPKTPDARDAGAWSRFTNLQNLKQLPQGLKEEYIDPQIAQATKARQAASEGRYSEAAGHGAAAALPFLGPQAADVGEALGQGDYGTAAKRGAIMAGGMVLPRVLGKVLGPLMEGGGEAAMPPAEPVESPTPTAVGWKELPAPRGGPIRAIPGEPSPPPRPAPWDTIETGPAGRSAEDIVRENPELAPQQPRVRTPPPPDTGGDWSERSPGTGWKELPPPSGPPIGAEPGAPPPEPAGPAPWDTVETGPAGRSAEDIARQNSFPPSQRATVADQVPAATPPAAPPSGKLGLVNYLRDAAERAGRANTGAGRTIVTSPDEVPIYGGDNATIDQVENLYRQLKPKWAAARARTADVPFDVPDESFPEFYQRVLTDPERELMGGERTVRRNIEASAEPEYDAEAGFIDPQAAGQAMNVLRDKALPAAAQWRMSSLLGPAAVVKKGTGDIAAVLSRAAEEAVGGNPGQAGRLVKSFFSPQTARDIATEFRTPSTPGEPSTFGSVKGLVGAGGRTMQALTKGTQQAIERAGYLPEEAKAMTYTNVPKSDIGAWATRSVQKHPILRLIAPFPRVLTNIAERGIERTPGLGALAQWLSKGNLQTSIPKQLLGTAAGVAGYKYGEKVNPYLRAALGPYALPFAMASAMKTAKKVDPTKSAWNELVSSLPLPSSENPYNPGQWGGSMVPSAPTDIIAGMGGTPRSQYDTKDRWLLGPAIAKIPILRDMLLRQKREHR